jgi:Ca2+-binding RTX toxin-like protein
MTTWKKSFSAGKLPCNRPGGLLELTLANPAAIANVVGTSFDDTIYGNSQDNHLYGAAGNDQLYGREGNDTLVADLPSIVWLDFVSAYRSERGDYDYSLAEQELILEKIAARFASFNWQFTLDENDARQWSRHSGRAYVQLVFSEGRGGGVLGDAGEIDFRNINREIVSQVNINPLKTTIAEMLGPEHTEEEFSSLVVAITAHIAAHELGHTAGLRHADALGPIGSGFYQNADLSRIYPPYMGPLEANETPWHIIASPASLGTTIFDATRDSFFGAREAIKLAFNETGGTRRELASDFNQHSTLNTAEDLGTLRALAVPNLAPAEGFAFSEKEFKVHSGAVVGTLQYDLSSNSTEIDFYRIEAEAGEWLNVELIASSLRPLRGSPFDGQLRVFDANGVLVAETDDEFEGTKDPTLIDYFVEESGPYFIAVSLSDFPAFAGTGGRYELFVSRFEAVDSGEDLPVPIGDTFVGGLGGNLLIGGSHNDLFLATEGSTGDQLYGRRGFDTLDVQGVNYSYELLDSIELVLNGNNPPEASLDGIPDGEIVEGSSFVVALVGATDTSSEDTAAGFRYSFTLFDNEGNIVEGFLPLAINYEAASTDHTALIALPNDGTYQVWGRVFDQRQAFSDYWQEIIVRNAVPEGNLSGPISVVHGRAGQFVVDATDASASDEILLRYSFALSEAELATSYASATSSNIYEVTFASAGHHVVYARVFDKDGGILEIAHTVMVESTWVTLSDSGIELNLPGEINLPTLNLYSDFSPEELPDLRLIGAATGAVSGSLIIDQSTGALRFVPTGGVLPADDYTLTLFSRNDAFADINGSLIDGDADGVPGGDFDFHFVIESSSSPLLSIPDIVRGPGQAIHLPLANSDPGIPLVIEHASGVRSIELDLVFDPSLLQIHGVVPAGLPQDWTVTFEAIAVDRVSLSLAGASELGTGALTLLRLLASVPESATYGLTSSLRIENPEVLVVDGENSELSPVNGRYDEAIVHTAFIGDADSDAHYTAQDAAIVAAVWHGHQSGFGTVRLLDPRLLGDVDQSGTLSAQDVEWIIDKSFANSLRPEIADPIDLNYQPPWDRELQLEFPERIISGPGESVTLPVSLTGDATGIRAIEFSFAYPETVVELPVDLAAGLQFAEMLVNSGNWELRTRTSASNPELVYVALIRPFPAAIGNGTIVEVLADVRENVGGGEFSLPLTGSDIIPPIRWSTTSGSLLIIAHPPTDILVDSEHIIEDDRVQEEPLLFATLATVDDDPIDAFVYSLVDGNGDDDNHRFSIEGDRVYLNSGELLDFETQPSYSLRVKVADLKGNATEKWFTLQVENAMLLAQPPKIQEGSAQRSLIKSLTLVFDQHIEFANSPVDAFELIRREDAGAVVLSVQHTIDEHGRSVVELFFSGALTRNGALLDGNYQLRIRSTEIVGWQGDDYLFGAEEADQFFAYFADVNGDRTVSLAEFNLFRSTFGRFSTDPLYDERFDFEGIVNGLGGIGISDFGQFRARFGRTLDWQ